jgi:putative effector of murein hydrolase LrgA (UPF0299 family)
MLTPEQIEAEFKHLATKEELHKEMLVNTRWLIGTMIVLQIPTWVGLLQIWNFLATIASRLPK